jgi:acetyl-CoA carboxylase carboxyltransferase component
MASKKETTTGDSAAQPAAETPELQELKRRRAQARRMGGDEAIARMHAQGRMTARERIDVLLDAGSLRELGQITGQGQYDDSGDLVDLKPINAIVGTGRIGGGKVAVSADDYTIRAGSSEATNSDKWIFIERMALSLRMPLIRLVDTAGGSVKILEQAGASKIPEYTTWPSVKLMTEVPVVGVALGACAGLGAVKVLSSHFSVMVRDQAQVFAAGPPVVKQAFGIDVDKNDLGGYKVHRKSGLVHNEAVDERDALAQVRRFLSYMPRCTHHAAPVVSSDDDPNRADDWLVEAIPSDSRKIYDPRKILASVFDRDSVFEIGRYHGGGVITCLARLNGVPVGVIANDPKIAGAMMTLTAAYKMERHIELCSIFGLPVVNFVDQPGTAIGAEAETAGTLLGALRVARALEQIRAPWVSIIVRRCFGLAGSLHAPKYDALNHRFAWPTARWGSIPIEGGAAAAHRAEIEAAADPKAELARLEKHYHKLASPYRTAERFGVVDVIDPRETRSVLCDWIDDAWQVIRSERRES